MDSKRNIIDKIKPTVLVVDDELINQEILKEILCDTFEVIIAGNGKEALDVLDTSLEPISLILLDLNMPEMGGFEFLQIVKSNEAFKKIPVIVSTSDKESELSALEHGAVDFITKPFDMPEIILARAARTIELSEDRYIIQASERDELTGAYNKHIFVEYVQKIDSHRQDADYDMVVIGIDKFHLFNELHGREEGEKVLKIVSDSLKAIARDIDGIVGKLHSFYFVLYVARQQDHQSIMQRLTKQLEQQYGITNLRFHAGIYQINPDDNRSVDDYIDRALNVCEEIQNDETVSYLIFDSERQKRALFRERLVQDAQKAINERQFEVYYQPKINIKGERFQLSSAEALIRWNHPELGMISPGIFIPLFEENRFVRELDRFVWKEAAHQIAKWKKEYKRTIPISVNVSRVDMFDSTIVDFLKNAVDEAGILPSDLYLEITESAYNNETNQITEILNNLKASGFTIEVDDFGSGYSSLNTLSSFEFDVLKLDIQFIREMFRNEKSMRMIEIVAEIAEVLKVALVAEGVESKEQCEALKRIGYDIIQGYYFSKPLKIEDFNDFIENGGY